MEIPLWCDAFILKVSDEQDPNDGLVYVNMDPDSEQLAIQLKDFATQVVAILRMIGFQHFTSGSSKRV